MANTDIVVKLRLDTKDAVSQANNWLKTLQKQGNTVRLLNTRYDKQGQLWTKLLVQQKKKQVLDKKDLSNQVINTKNLLAMLFAGQRMQHWMDGYVQKTKQMIGAEQLHSVAMEQLMLPAQMDLFQLTSQFDQWILSLDEGQRRWMGWGVQGVRWAGSVLSYTSQLALTMQSIKSAGGIGGMFKTVGNIAGTGGLFGSISKAFNKFGGKLSGFFQNLGQKLSDTGEYGAMTLVDYIGTGISWLAGALSGAFTWLVSTVGGTISKYGITGALSMLGGAIYQLLKDIADKLGITKFAGWVATGALALGSSIWQFFIGLAAKVNLSNFVSWLATGALVLGSAIWSFLTGLAAKIGLSNFAGWLATGALIIGSAIWSFLTGIAAKLGLTAFASTIGTGVGAIGGALSGLFGAITGVIGGVISSLGAIGGGIAAIVGGLIAKLGIPNGEKAMSDITAWVGQEKNDFLRFGRSLLAAPSYFAAWVSKSVGDLGKWLGFAEGGVVTKATPAIVGEAGPEAIIPLDKLGNMGSTNVNINVYASISNPADLNALAQKIRLIFERERRYSAMV